MDRVKFQINGVEYSVGCEVSSDMTLVQYIRKELNLTGTKYMCLEGGCGACIVMVRKRTDGLLQSINSCLVSITSCHGWEIFTIESKGNRLDGYSTVQKTLAEDNGTQCGYCSPGWVMNMHSLLENGNKPTMLEIEKSFGSNLCRCTGYRSIIKAFRKFGCDAPESVRITDIEDLKICKKTGVSCDKTKCDEDFNSWCILSDEEVTPSVLTIKLKDNKYWYKVYEMQSIFDVWEKHNDSDTYMLVNGNSQTGITPIESYPTIMIDVESVTELRTHTLDQNLIIGAGFTIAEFVTILNAEATQDDFKYLEKLVDHIDVVGSVPIKNLASVAGNLMMKNTNNAFASDLYLLFETVGAYLTIQSPTKTEKISMQDFLNTNMNKKVLVNVILPPLNNQHKLVTYKVMPRAQSAGAIVNAGFLYKLCNNKVTSARIVYGGLSGTFIRAGATENYLKGKYIFTNSTLQGALEVLKGEMVVTYGIEKPPVNYRKQLALSLFYKGLLSICPEGIINTKYVSGTDRILQTRPVSTATQSYDSDSTMWPLCQPIPKVEALIQCAGEAKYTDDIPAQAREVHVAFVLSTVCVGEIIQIDSSRALKESGVIAFYTAADIPGENSFTPGGTPFFNGNEEVMASEKVMYMHQPIGIIVAETQVIANRAAKMVTATYKNVKDPVIDIKAAMTDSNRVTLYTSKASTETGTDAVVKTITGSDTIYGQRHITLENMACVCFSTEEGLECHVTSQWMDGCQLMMSKALGIDTNKIDVHVRRIGGGYGLKISRPIQMAVACGLVVQKLNRPARCVMDVATTGKAIGKRLPCHTDYEVAVNATGVIQSNKYRQYEDNGYMINETLTHLGTDVFNNCYTEARWDYAVYDVITDTAKNTWCRSPGTAESIALAESVMERISCELGLDPFDVRVANVELKHNQIVEMAEALKVKACYAERKAEIEKFNCENRWKSRSLRCSLVRWTPYGYSILDVNLAICHGDGSVIITHGGIEMGQGINTKAVQICAYYFKIPIDKIQIKGNNTIVAPNCFVTGGSYGSQNVGVGVRRCCETMLARLEPIRTELGNNPTWLELITQAYNSDIDLKVHDYVGAADTFEYHVYGVSMAEVELDILTGEYMINRVDICQDAGCSLSPEIDVGQVEGAFMMGVGYWTSEDLKYDPSTGELLNYRIWDYCSPMLRDTPLVTNVELLKGSYSVKDILGAKGIGEPPLCLAVVIAFAIRGAVVAAREKVGISASTWFDVEGPWTGAKVLEASCLNTKDFLYT